MNTHYALFISILGHNEEIYVDVEYEIIEGQKGNYWQEEIKEFAEIESIQYGNIDISGLLNKAQTDAIEQDLLKQENSSRDYLKECAMEVEY